MEENNREGNELNDKSTEYKVGYSFGSIAAYIVGGSILAVFVVSILKLLMWIWAL